MSLESLLDEFRNYSTSEREKGALFENFIAKYLKTDPQYSQLENVWRWSDWPFAWGQDDGIDLVAQDRDSGEYWAIQCKFYGPDERIEKKEIDSFFTASGRKFSTPEGQRQFSQRLIVSSTDHWSSLAEASLADQTIPTFRLRLKDLADSPVDWDAYSLRAPEKMVLRTRKALRDHQKEAVSEILTKFKDVDRGKLVMACGTGKTFTSLRAMEQTLPEPGIILFLAPSISLVAQTLREWTADAESPFHAFVICSDSKVGKDDEDIRSFDLAYPSTTDAKQIFAKYQQLPQGQRTIVIFSTYQSIDVVTEIQDLGFPQFDLVVCDEAHRTTGLTRENDSDSHFVKVHDDTYVNAKKRLYMTATPRIYGEATKKKAGEKSAVLFSMDDESIYGPEFYNLPFGQAVERDLLSDYKVVLVAVDETEMASLANEANAALALDEKQAIDTDFAIKIVGSWKGLSKSSLFLLGEDGSQEKVLDEKPMRRAIAFSNSIKDSKFATEAFTRIVDLYSQKAGALEDEHLVNCELEHVDGTMNAVFRKSRLDWLKAEADSCRILSNARCLSEGIDVPALDAVIFLDTRDSIVDIVQSVGRVMRKAPGKTYGYIILPVGIPMGEIKDYNSFIETDKRFKGIWKIIRSLRAHDESLVDEAEFQKKIKVAILKPGSGSRQTVGNLDLEIPNFAPVTDISKAVYTAIPKKLGDREYWSDWAKDVAQIVGKVVLRIGNLVEESDAAIREFAAFLAGLRENINAEISHDDAIEMLAQHLITRPVFDAIFEGYEFSKHNPVAKAMDRVLSVLDRHQIDSETESMQRFYDSIRDRVRYAKSDKSRQDIIRNLYDTFFQSAFPKMSDRLGIVYTPVEVVDFILRSADVALKEHFGKNLGDEGVQILDPFTGTGTFIVRLLQLGLISPEDLIRKFATEIHANEIVLLAYYIAAINIETTYHSLTGEYKPFPGIVLTDTFQLSKKDALQSLNPVLPENNERVRHQMNQDIRVIVGNPPYSVGQTSANDGNQNTKYKELDARIRQTYVAKSGATNKNKVYDAYIRALRWASDRIGTSGIICFVTNGAFIEKNTADGLRKCLHSEFSDIYIINLKGFIRGKSGEDAKREGQGIFNIMTGVCITVMVKNPEISSRNIHYHNIGDYLSRDEKLSFIDKFKDVS
jgi:predicted helicase